MCYALIMEGFGVKYWSTHDPNLTRTDLSSPENYPLNFFVTAIVIYAIGVIQYAIKYMCKFKFPLKYEEFVDLCSIVNISVLMFDETFHGYYIHGRSPYGQAETSTKKLRLALESEGKG